MSADFHKPVRMPADMFDAFEGGMDPARILRLAHDTAHTLVNRARASDDPAVLERLVAYTDEHGLDALAELWARSGARTLPGALWRIYLLRALIRQDAAGTSLLFQRGSETLATIDTVVAGAEMPTGPEEITSLADQILRGVFRGDLATALDRAAAFCRIMAAGATEVADDQELLAPDRSSGLTTRALRFSETAADLTASARLERSGSLE